MKDNASCWKYNLGYLAMVKLFASPVSSGAGSLSLKPEVPKVCFLAWYRSTRVGDFSLSYVQPIKWNHFTTKPDSFLESDASKCRPYERIEQHNFEPWSSPFLGLISQNWRARKLEGSALIPMWRKGSKPSNDDVQAKTFRACVLVVIWYVGVSVCAFAAKNSSQRIGTSYCG